LKQVVGNTFSLCLGNICQWRVVGPTCATGAKVHSICVTAALTK
jgi:hypothetical protein